MNGNGAPPTNEGSIKVVVRTLAGLTIIGLLTLCVLSYQGKDVPPELNTLLGGLVTALTAMLANTRPSAQAPAVPPADTGKIIVPEQPLKTEQTWQQP